MYNFVKLLAYLPLLPALLKLEQDVVADIADPSEPNLNATIQDAEALVERLFPNIPKSKVEAAAGIALVAITLESNHDIKSVGADLLVISEYLGVILGKDVTVSLA